MDNLNTVPSSGLFADVVDVINENMSLITAAVNTLEYKTDQFKGLYTSVDDFPTEVTGEGAWLGLLGVNGFPATVYTYVDGVWTSTGKTWEPDSAATAAVEEAKDEALDDIEAAKEAAIQALDLTYDVIN